MSVLTIDQAKAQVKMFMDTFRWEQDYYHRNRRDIAGTPVGKKRYNRYENGRKVYYTEEQFKTKVREYAESIGYTL